MSELETTKKMSPGFALFNCHVNDAKDRALAVLDEYFPKFADEIRTADEEGLMSIIGTEPTPATASFVVLVTMFVNESKEAV